MTDYEEAALRHHDDAHYLAAQDRYDNASHLIGIAAECALKNHMEFHGAKPVKVHLPELLVSYRTQLKGRTRATAAVVNQLVDGAQSFSDWSINDRYNKDGHVDSQLWQQRRLRAGKLFSAFGMRKRP